MLGFLLFLAIVALMIEGNRMTEPITSYERYKRLSVLGVVALFAVALLLLL